MLKKNIFSIIVALLIVYLSLADSNTFEKISFPKIPYMDKIVHFGMYFTLMSFIIFENRKFFKNTVSLFLIALIPFFYSVLLEILQSAFTVSRYGSFYDIIFNTAGIFASILLWLWIKPYIKDKIR